MEKFRRRHRGEAVHHSPLYRKIYRPSYRIVSTRFLTMIPVLEAAAKLPSQPVRIIAIDGRASSGKTTLSRQLATVLEAQEIHMDDFFLPVNLRTSARLAEAGGNVHYERFKQEVLPNLRKSAGFRYRKFDCSKMALGDERVISPGKWRIVEGAYSLHPEFGDYADLKLFFDIAPEEQMKRIRKRNGEKQAAVFASRWIPLEENYINQTGVIRRVDLILGRSPSR
jgi:uridine kinase